MKAAPSKDVLDLAKRVIDLGRSGGNEPDKLNECVALARRILSNFQPELPGLGDQVPKTIPNKTRGTLEEIVMFCVGLGLPVSDGEWFYWKCEGNGWKNGGKAIVDWRSTCRAWEKGKYFPSQKQSPITYATQTNRAHSNQGNGRNSGTFNNDPGKYREAGKVRLLSGT